MKKHCGYFNKVYYAYFLAICLIIHFYYTVSLILNMFFAADFWRINNNVVVILATFYINFKENSIELKLSILLIIRLVIGIFVGAMSLICFIAPANVLTLTYS